MSETLPLAHVKAKFSEMVDRVEHTHDRIVVTRNGRPAAVMISPADLAALEDTLELFSDPIAMNMEIEMAFGRGPAATSDRQTYRYWVAVTRRGRAPIEKVYFDVDVRFPRGESVVTHSERIDQIVAAKNRLLAGFGVGDPPLVAVGGPAKEPFTAGEVAEVLAGPLVPPRSQTDRRGRDVALVLMHFALVVAGVAGVVAAAEQSAAVPDRGAAGRAR